MPDALKMEFIRHEEQLDDKKVHVWCCFEN